MDTDILVGIDGSAHSEAALRWAVAEAAMRGVRVRLVLCWSYLGIGGGSDQKVGTTEADALATLEDVASRLPEDQRSRIDLVAVNDLPTRGLLDQATTSALVVVGSRGIGGVRGLVLGSVSRTIVERSAIPVVVVPATE